MTKEEISLFKQVAEKHRKKIKRGDWIIDDKDEICLIENIDKKDNTMMAGYGKNLRYFSIDNPEIIPLWTISDCLEFFEKREYTFERSYQLGGVFNVLFISGEGTIRGSGNTLLIACLKATLAVL